MSLLDKDCTKQLATLTTDKNGNTDVVEVTAGTVYVKELSAPAGYKVDKTIYPLTIKAGETATLKVSDTPKVTDTLIELFKIDMETQKDTPQGNASLAGAEFTWKYFMLASTTKTISLPKLQEHGSQRQSPKQTVTGQPITSQN